MAARNYSSVATPMALTAGINSIVTTMTVDSVAGLPASTPYTLIIDYGQATEEVVTVTGVAGMNLTIVRGEDGTSAQAHSMGAAVRHGLTARDVREPQQHMDASTGVHGLGVGVAVVGTSTTQTLTNKSISGATNTLSAIPQSAVTNLTTDLDAVEASVATLGASKANAVHTHSAADITSGTLAVAQGGTGAGTAAAARTALGAAAASHTHSGMDITSGAVPVARGGTGATDAATARTALGVAAASHTHARADVTGLVAALDNLPNEVGAGSATVTFAGGSTASATVTFTSPFINPPLVFTQITTIAAVSSTVILRVGTVTTTGFTVTASSVTGASLTGGVAFDWLAVLMNAML